MSQLLARLNLELANTTDPIKRAEIYARIGSYFARTGKFSETRTIIGDLRQQFGDGHSGQATAWIMLTEGLLHLYEHLSPQALYRIKGSQLLGLAMKDASIIAIASAWKAHLEFETSNFDSMVKSLELAIAHSSALDHGAQTRLGMVLTDSFLICGDRQWAQVWFLRSHEHAVKDGDQASIEALQYNRAAFIVARLRVERCSAEIGNDQLSVARIEIASAKNLQALTRIGAFTNLVHLCDARLLILEQEYSRAIQALESIRGSAPFASYNFSQSFVDLELAFCLLKLGHLDEAISRFDSIDWKSIESLDLDEQLIATWMLLCMCRIDGVFGIADEVVVQLEMLSRKYEEIVMQLLIALRPFHIAS
ncbi:MAG: hypothetical protein Q7S91_05965 [Aquabacterium sp.]|nr:hypothetical protein [Aquabacterium sp.]